MSKSLGLIPVGNAVAVVEDTNWLDDAIDAPVLETLVTELTEDIERLEFEKEMTEVRIEGTMEYLTEKFRAKIDEIEDLKNELELRSENFDEDDIENEPEKRDINDLLKEKIETAADQDEKSDIGFDEENTDEDKEYQTTRDGCRKMFRKIAAQTHPDKCGNTSRVDIFRKAKHALESLNLPMMEKLYHKVFGKHYGKINLVEKVMSLRTRQRTLQHDIDLLKKTTGWALHLLELEVGRDIAAFEYGKALEQMHAALLRAQQGY